MKLQSHIPYLVTIAAFCLIARADAPPNSFSAGSTISAAQMNQNFVAAFAGITQAKAVGAQKAYLTAGGPYPLVIPTGITQLSVEGVGGGGGGAGGNCNYSGASYGESGESAL